jgi:transposase InsO family protein
MASRRRKGPANVGRDSRSGDRRYDALTSVARGRTIAICDEFEAYGWCRVQAALRHQGIIANHKRVKRLMREHDLQPLYRRRHVATKDSGHDQPIFPDRAKELIQDGLDQLWVADLTYVAIIGGFAYVAIILDAWSRRVVGYATGRLASFTTPADQCAKH